MEITSQPGRNEVLLHRLGFGLSALCLVHCLALPWLLAVLPLVLAMAFPDALQDTGWLHAALIAPVVLVSGPALLRGHPSPRRIALVLTAFAALVGGLLVDTAFGEQVLTVMGAALLLAAHGAKLRGAHRHERGWAVPPDLKTRETMRHKRFATKRTLRHGRK